MPWPGTMNLGTLTADFREWMTGDALEATVYITSPNALVSTTDDIIVPHLEERRQTAGGELSVDLPTNNEAEWQPNGWQYLIRAVFPDGRKMAWLASFGGSADLADIGVEIPYPNSTGAFVVTYPLPPSGGGGAVDSVNGRTGAVVLTKTDVGLTNADNTSDANKPVSTAQAAADAVVAAGAASALSGHAADSTGIHGIADTAALALLADVIAKAIVDAKGDLIVATADGVVARLAVGTNGHVLTADDAESTGVKWAAGGGGGGSSKPQIARYPLHNQAPVSNPAGLAFVNNRPVLTFDQTTQQAAIFTAFLPAAYAGGGLTVSVGWSAVPTSGTVGWLVSIERVGEVLDTDTDSFASAQTITAATVPGTSGNLDVTSVNIASGASMDSLAAGEMFRIKIERDVANDTAAGLGYLHFVEIKEQ